MTIIGDNCCYCYLAGIKSLSDLSTDDIIYASFKNHLCEVGVPNVAVFSYVHGQSHRYMYIRVRTVDQRNSWKLSNLSRRFSNQFFTTNEHIRSH